MKCPYCLQEDRQVKAGRTKFGSQRYKCQYCKHKYIPVPKRPGYPEEVRMKAISLYLAGVGFRGIARILKVNHQSVANWVNRYAANQPPSLLKSSLIHVNVNSG